MEGKQGVNQEQDKKIQELDNKVESLRIEQESHDTIHRLGGYGLTPNPSVAAPPKPVEKNPLPPDAPSWLRKGGAESLPSEPPETTNVRAKLLNSVDCPSAKEGPALPVLLEVPVEDLYRGDKKHMPNRRCVVAGRCQGDASSKRARIGTELIACFTPKGKTGFSHVEGRLWGSDGKLGMPGKHDKRGKEPATVLATLNAGLSPFISPCVPSPPADVPSPPAPEQPSAPAPDLKQGGEAVPGGLTVPGAPWTATQGAQTGACGFLPSSIGFEPLTTGLQEAANHFGKQKRRILAVEVKDGAEGILEMELPVSSWLFLE